MLSAGVDPSMGMGGPLALGYDPGYGMQQGYDPSMAYGHPGMAHGGMAHGRQCRTLVLAQLGLAEDTVVLFTADNGGANYIGIEGINHPYRGWKLTLMEGGGCSTCTSALYRARLLTHIPVTYQ